MKNGKPRIGLACAGGVVEGGIYEVGALCALEDSIIGLDLNRLHVYVGVSSGSIIASCLANGVPIKTLCRSLFGQAEPQLNLEPGVLFKPAFAEYFRRIRNLPRLLWKGLEHYLLRPEDISLMQSVVGMGTLLPTGFFDNDNLRTYLERVFTTYGKGDDFRQLDTLLRVIAVNLDTAEVVAFGKEMADVPISRTVQASTALPMLYCPVEIEGAYYIDGVARRTLHASVALEENLDLLITINPIVPINLELVRRKHGIEPGSLVDYGLPIVLSQTFRMMIYSRMVTGFRSYRHQFPDTDFLLLEPSADDYSVFFSNIFSLSNRHEVCEHAYQNTRRYLRNHAEMLKPVLARHGLYLRERTLYDETRTLEKMLGTYLSGTPKVHDRASEVLEQLETLLETLEYAQKYPITQKQEAISTVPD